MTIPVSQNQFPRVLFSSGDDSTPVSGLTSIYQKADGQLYGKNSDGVEKLLLAVKVGDPFSPAPNDIILSIAWDQETGYQFINAPFATLVGNQLVGALAAFPGFGASKTFKSNATADGYEWVD